MYTYMCICTHGNFVLSSHWELSGCIFGCYAAKASSGFSLIVIDPPWENGSAQQKSKYAIAYLFPYHFKVSQRFVLFFFFCGVVLGT